VPADISDLGDGRICLRLSQFIAESYHKKQAIFLYIYCPIVFMVAVASGFFYLFERSLQMEKKRVFTGVATAVITPFDEYGVDYESFGKIIDWQIESGINALVVCGTTGEASTLTDDEHRQVISYAVKKVNGRVPVIAGTGSNDTAYAVDLTKYACDAGADGVLVVTPYYNKCTQKGLVALFTQIADISTKPVILYNVPSRTGINIEPKTYACLAEHPNISGFKEANGNISKIVETMSYVNGKLDMYSGNDDQIVPLMALGGVGVISVLSNIMPSQTREICDAFFEGNVEKAAKLQYKYHAIIDALFCEVNPIPVKAAMNEMGFCRDIIRLPLTNMEAPNRQKLVDLMKGLGII
jgi:4-hydroxy-tetrahydrodipicolinate synthase